MIQVTNLRRVYHTYEKAPGVLGALRSIVSRKRKDITAVNDISFSINQGEIVGFVGPNGSGKTTTLKMLSGVLTPTHGECRVLDHEPSKRKRDFKRQIALVMGQKYQLMWDLPAIDTFRLHRDLYEVDEPAWRSTMDTLVELLGVQHVIDTPVRQLSLGERMKCELITALLHEPKVLFLDEPTIGLDAASQRHLREFLRAYQQSKGTTMIITSHYTQDIASLCPRVIVIKQGNIVYDGDYSKLVAIAEAEKRVLLRIANKVTKDDIKKLATISSNPVETIDSHTFRIRFANKDFGQLSKKIFDQFSIDFFQAEDSDFTQLKLN